MTEEVQRTLTARTDLAQPAAIWLTLPPFWPKNPKVWIAQVEAQFHLQRLTSQLSRYWHVVAALPPEVADLMADVLAAPSSVNAYDHFKEVLLERTTLSERARLQQLIGSEDLGDRRPSHLLSAMQQLLQNSTSDTDCSILQELFLQRLPHTVRMILAAADDMPLVRLAALADKVMECTLPGVSSVSSPSAERDTAIARVESRLDKLVDVVAALQHQPERASCRRSQSHASSRRLSSPATSGSSSHQADHCWYHRNFGSRARKCTSPCAWQGNAQADH